MSYTLTTLAIPSLSHLPSASKASATLSYIQTTSTRQILTLASISSLSLLTAYSLASPRGKHPYLLWTALVSFLGGQGVEYWFNGLSRFPSLRSRASTSEDRLARGGVSSSSGGARRKAHAETSPSNSGYVDVVATPATSPTEVSEDDEMSVNGEKVEMEMVRERRVQKVRTLVAGLGFAMGVVGIWGDGAK